MTFMKTHISFNKGTTCFLRKQWIIAELNNSSNQPKQVLTIIWINVRILITASIPLLMK
jgi:hypothetical protein